MPHTIKEMKQLLTRVRRIKGQADALETALEQGGDCSAILQQIAAIRGAVNGLMAEVLEGHIREHLGVDEIPAGDLDTAKRYGQRVAEVAAKLHG